jgi:hypothetical protein
MFLRHHLAKGFNTIPLKNLRYLTEHQKRGEELTHVGWKIQGDYAGENVRAQKHKYEIVFTPEEALDFKARLDEMLPRFDTSNLSKILKEDRIVEVDEE